MPDGLEAPAPLTWADVMARPRPTEPARARRAARDGLEVPFESERVTFPAVVTSHPTPPEEPHP